MIIILIIRGVTLEGAILGIRYYILEINTEKLSQLQVSYIHVMCLNAFINEFSFYKLLKKDMGRCDDSSLFLLRNITGRTLHSWYAI